MPGLSGALSLAMLQRRLAAAGILVSVNVAPIIPGLKEREIPAVFQAAAEAGFTVLRLPLANNVLFAKCLESHFPGRRDKVLNQMRTMRNGKSNESEWGSRMKGEGIFSVTGGFLDGCNPAINRLSLPYIQKWPSFGAASRQVPGTR